mgnify:CR=1 FL=1
MVYTLMLLFQEMLNACHHAPHYTPGPNTTHAPNHARRSMRFDASADAQREVELHLAQINVGDTAQSSKPAPPVAMMPRPLAV